MALPWRLALVAWSLSGLVSGRTQFLGVAIAGGDFSCEIDGRCPTSNTQLPLKSLGGGDGEGQMKHFVADSNVNIFRLPISWQFLVNNNGPAAPLDPGNLDRYDQLMQTCLATGAHCMIDVHNFARYDDAIVGQGGPSGDDFASLWGELAGRYAGEERVSFGLMNEPHHLDVDSWARSCQAAIDAIRGAGAGQQMILLPGTNFDSAATLLETGSVDALMDLRNPDGSVDGLVLDVHKYLDVDNSGTHDECVTDNVAAFQGLADHLRDIGRLAFVSETGASRSSSCMEKFCAQNKIINENSDVFLGIIGWAAGSFSTGYIMSLTPETQNGRYVDNKLMSECVVAPWVNSKETLPPVEPKESPSGSGGSRTTPTSSSTDATGNSSAGGSDGDDDDDQVDDANINEDQPGLASSVASPLVLCLLLGAGAAGLVL